MQSARGWLGVELEPNTGSPGARVRHVVHGSPAERAGIHEADVIVRVDDVNAAGPGDVIRKVSGTAPGKTIKVSITRAGATKQVDVLLAAMPDPDEMLRLDHVGSPSPGWKGLAKVAGTVPDSLGEMRGRVVVLDFWATWCVACRMAAPRLSQWQSKFGAQGLSVIGITDDPVVAASKGAQSFGMTYAVASDETYATQRAFGVRALPTIFVIDKRGVVRDVAVGFDPRREAELEALVQKLLAEPSP
jgi:thiol-disulfide isomerase/thioredoxin